MFVDPLTGDFLPAGSFVKPAACICETLKVIAKTGGRALSEGPLAKDLAQDLKEMGSLVTLQDLASFK